MMTLYDDVFDLSYEHQSYTCISQHTGMTDMYILVTQWLSLTQEDEGL